VAVTVFQSAEALTTVQRRSGLRRAMHRKSVIAFLMTLPLILLVLIFVLYPALY
jgi:multiple sugar transport system permease protein